MAVWIFTACRIIPTVPMYPKCRIHIQNDRVWFGWERIILHHVKIEKNIILLRLLCRYHKWKPRCNCDSELEARVSCRFASSVCMYGVRIGFICNRRGKLIELWVSGNSSQYKWFGHGLGGRPAAVRMRWGQNLKMVSSPEMDRAVW